MSNNESSSLTVTLIAIYLIISQIATIYFWYKYSQDHNFISSLIIGPIVGELKAYFGQYFY